MSARWRRGSALLAVTIAIAVLGTLASAASWTARHRQAGARRLAAIHAADGAVARLLDSALAAWPNAARAAMAVGTRMQLAAGPGGEWLAVARLTHDHFRLDAAVRRGDALAYARDAASLLVRLERPRIDARAPLVATGSATVGASFALTTVPPAGCPAPSAALADVLAADAAAITWKGPAGTVVEDAGVSLPDVATVAARADVVVPDGGTWVPPDDSVRVVAAAGAMSLGPGTGAGVVVAAGPITLVGPLDFSGVVIAPAGVTHAGTATVGLRGALLAGGVATLIGPGALRPDPCAVRAALDAAARAVPPPVWGMAWEP